MVVRYIFIEKSSFMRLVLYIFFLFSFCSDIFAQSEEHDPVYISTGCSAYAYHKTLFCGTIKSCRHNHDKVATKRCPKRCEHIGHVEKVSYETALSKNRSACQVCYGKRKRKKYNR